MEFKIDEKLRKSTIFAVLEEKCKKSCDYDVISLVNEVYDYSKNKTKTIIKNMPQFTLHDIDHINNMLNIAAKLITKTRLTKLSIPDLMMIIISICLHDIGMAPEETSVQSWKGLIETKDLTVDQNKEKKDFYRFRETHQNIIRDIDELRSVDEHSKADMLENYIISDYIRTTHAERAKKIIAQDWNSKIVYRDTDLTTYLASICFSHNEDSSYILDMESFCICGDDIYLCIPFVAVILRLCDIIDFDPKRTPRVLYSHLAVSNPVSLIEWNKHLSINAWTINSKRLTYSAQCNHPAIEAAIYQFCDLIDNELRNATLIVSNISGEDYEIDTEVYKLPIPPQVNRKKIQAKRDIVTNQPVYRYNDTKFTLSKNQVIDLLMGTKLYGKPDVALRELIQNSIDACHLRGKLAESWQESYTPQIAVSLIKEGKEEYLEVEDNGMGMNQFIIDNYYSNIGSSYYKSNDFYDLVGGLESSFTPISRFGIGILSCFMVSDYLEVNTRRVSDQYQCDDALKLTIEGYDSLFVIVDGERKSPGTSTKLKLRKNHPWESLKDDKFIESVKRIVPNPPFDLVIKTKSKVVKHTKFEKETFDLKQIKDYSWDRTDGISVYRCEFDNQDKGLRGLFDVAVITQNGKVVESINVSSKEVMIDEENYTLSIDIKYGNNSITKHSDSVSVNEKNEVTIDSYTRKIFSSKSLLSIHGIEVPCKLIPDYTTYGEKALINFPLPIAFKIDIYGENDLNLNSARTKVIYDEKWLKFEKDFEDEIFKALESKIGKKRWDKLLKIIEPKSSFEPKITKVAT